MKKKDLRAAIYVRVNGDNEQNKICSLQKQIDVCLAKSMSDGNALVRIVVDSGSSLVNRSGKQLIKELVVKNAFDVLYVTSLDRISRSVTDFFEFKKLLSSHRIKIQVVETESYQNKIVETVMNAVTEFERNQN